MGERQSERAGDRGRVRGMEGRRCFVSLATRRCQNKTANERGPRRRTSPPFFSYSLHLCLLLLLLALLLLFFLSADDGADQRHFSEASRTRRYRRDFFNLGEQTGSAHATLEP